MMPPPPAGLGSGPGMQPPGGGAPPTTPNAAGPAGTVPQVSNERRPGLTYNTSNEGMPLIRTASESDFNMFMEKHPNITLAFYDYLVDQQREDERDEDISKLAYSDIERAYTDFPAHERAYEQRIHSEVESFLAKMPPTEVVMARVAKLAAAHEEAATVEDTPEEEHEFVLKSNQELQETDGREEILERTSKRQFKIEPSAGKRYSIVDPLAPELEETETTDDTADAEPAGPGTDTESSP